jgi:hypothetical protein
MTALDFGRSFVTFVTRGRENNARIQVEARCTLRDERAGTTEEFFLVASCKSEDTYAERSLFRVPNYDFCGIFSDQQYAIIRTHASAAEDAPDVGRVADRFERVYLQTQTLPGRPLLSNADVVAATLDGQPIVARTEIGDERGRFRCLLEYPVKTMNANDMRGVYQVDTGPVPFPDWDANVALAVGRFRLAYVAFNAPDHADFVLLAPTDIAPGAATAHYSEVVALGARNELVALLSEDAGP